MHTHTHTHKPIENSWSVFVLLGHEEEHLRCHPQRDASVVIGVHVSTFRVLLQSGTMLLEFLKLDGIDPVTGIMSDGVLHKFPERG
jgi:hypothetical protein